MQVLLMDWQLDYLLIGMKVAAMVSQRVAWMDTLAVASKAGRWDDALAGMSAVLKVLVWVEHLEKLLVAL